VGLALAHRVITDHGGTLAAANAPEGGAVFTIRLPL
jgi:C4-dicarboxylate-specific signal transduction histidine kinase